MSNRIETLVDQMTLEEQVSLLSGEDAWSLPAISRLKVGKLRVTDGPNGARGEKFVDGTRSAAFPVGIALGATWNVELVEEVGRELAREVKAKGAHVSLAPTVNIHRSVTNGRNFECYSEDPILTAELSTAYIEGLQGEGVAATIKHFAGNESEIERTTMNSEVGERALREIYLVPFESAVKKAGTWAIMSSYNRLNGHYTSENSWLLDEVLRNDWKYDGVVMSDWWGSHSTTPTVNAGLDLEMPGPPRDRGKKLIAAVEAGEVSREAVRQRALNVLRLIERTGAIDDFSPFKERVDDRTETRALIRRTGAEAAVLLKNDGVLPLGTGKIAVIGPNAKTAQIMGGGSAHLRPYYSVSPWEGLVAALGEERLTYAEGCSNFRYQPLYDGTFEVDFFDGPDLTGPVVAHLRNPSGNFLSFHGQVDGVADNHNWSARFTGTFTPKTTGEHRLGVVSVGLAKVYVDGKLAIDNWSNWVRGRAYFEEGSDEAVAMVPLEADRTYEIAIEFSRRPTYMLDIPGIRFGISLPLGDADIRRAVDAARSAEAAVVFIGRTGEWDTEGSDLPSIELPGRQNELVSAVAAANPRTVVVLQTGGPVEMPWLGEVAGLLQAWYPGQEAGNAIADVLTGAADPGGRLPQTFPVSWRDNPTHSQDPEVYPGLNGKVRYEEGVFIGYRHYDKTGIAPLFPFGFGLSYTNFALSDLTIDDSQFESNGAIIVSATITNTGNRRGKPVAQVYVLPVKPPVDRPEKELKAFAKVELDPGASATVTLELEPRAFAYYREDARDWMIAAGEYGVGVGFSSADLSLIGKVVRAHPLTLPV